MEIGQLQCDNLGMTRDTDVSAVGRSKDGVSTYAFENHNIRILAVNDNTKFAVTNEKSTKYEGTINGVFIGGCVLNNYLTLFIKDTTTASTPDYIYRLEYLDGKVYQRLLFKGNLNFTSGNPIEAMGFYESEEIQKVYWVDGVNQNRFINIVDANHFKVGTTRLKYDANYNETLYDGTLYALCDSTGDVKYYAEDLSLGSNVWPYTTVHNFIYSQHGVLISALKTAYPPTLTLDTTYNNYSFDFQGRVNNIPHITIEKNYNKAGSFQAGTIQYFFTYYNKYGVETCIVYNSDLQYLSLPNRGAKADEAVTCGFDMSISNIDITYDYLRIYACYRSGINGVVNSRIVADINLDNTTYSTVLYFTDMGSEGTEFNADDMQYIGGQKIIANTLDYKQDTLFLGDITLPNGVLDIEFNKKNVLISDLKDSNNQSVNIKEGYWGTTPFIKWAYKYVSPIATKGLYQYDQEIAQSQEEVAGFKWREVYRFGIQFMNHEGEWTSAYWLGDKYCDCSPRTFTISDTIKKEADPDDPTTQTEYWPIDANGNVLKTEYIDVYDNIVPDTEAYVKTKETIIDFTEEGCYIAKAIVDINAIKSNLTSEGIDYNDFIAYRLLVVESDITNRRIVEQGVINPTMFNYADRYYNRPYSIPSWIFRPRSSKIVNRHYDTLPLQTDAAAELQGIVKRQIPGFKKKRGGTYNSYIFIIASNAGSIWSGYIQYKLIYYNAGSTDKEKAERLYLSLFTGNVNDTTPASDSEFETAAELTLKYQIALKEKNNSNPGSGIIKYGDADYPADQTAMVAKLKSGYIPYHIYDDNYKVIASHWENHNTNKDKQGALSKWSTLRGWMVDDLTNAMRNTTEAEVGPELAGKIVLSNAMIPSSDQLKSIGRAGSNAAEITMAIMAALVAAAAVVISALSFGTLAAPMAVAATVAVSCATSLLACSAVGCAAAAATLDLARQDMSDLSKEMLAMGYVSVGAQSTNLSSRKHRSKYIGVLLDKLFTPEGYDSNGGLYSWNVPLLKTEPKWGYPFRTGHPYTEYGCIGEDYNAFAISGKLSSLEENEKDLKAKQNLFCIDEAIVTMNAPDVEANSHIINNSRALKLDLVGMIPIDSTYGMYKLETEQGLNSNSQVLQGRYKENKIEDSSSEAVGMLNGDIYQDFKAEEANFDEAGVEVHVNESVDNYRLFMWHREVAGFAFPNISLKDGLGADVLENRSKIVNKIFANMRYSTNTSYYKPFGLNIEPPTACLDAQSMLKVFDFFRDQKNYYENVDTISINNSYYPLILGAQKYPGTEQRITNAGLKDPVRIKFKETPHIMIPFSWNTANNGTTILPYLQSDDPLLPSDLYDHALLEGVDLEGTVKSIPTGAIYYLLEVNNCANRPSDQWNKEGVLTTDDILNLTDLCISDRTGMPPSSLGVSAKQAINNLVTALNIPKSTIIAGGHTNSALTSTEKISTALTRLLDTEKLYLFHPYGDAYYTISYNGTNWVSTKVTSIPTNSKIVITSLLEGQRKNTDSIFTLYHDKYIEDTSTTPSTRKWAVYPTETTILGFTFSNWEVLNRSAEVATNVGVVHLDSEGDTVYHPLVVIEGENGSVSYKIDFNTYIYLGLLKQGARVIVNTDDFAYFTSVDTNGLPYDGSTDIIDSTKAVVTTATAAKGSILTCNGTGALIRKDGDYEEAVGTVCTFTSSGLVSAFKVSGATTYYATKNIDTDNTQLVNLTDDISEILTNKPIEGTWNQDQLTWYADSSVPFLFLGELVKKEFDYSTWNGGTSQTSLQNLTWNVASHVTPINSVILNTWGDTFYQRWDCEKTYPSTEEDVNSNVEVLSFMLESHSNLDGRCDQHRGINNLLTARPSNTMYNAAYSQTDNFFSYQVLDNKFEKKHFEADVLWSLTKNNMDDIDKWTNLLATNEMSLDGRYGTIRKILNVNDILVTFQDTGIASIKYNESAALNTTSGLPLQMGNTGKVDGYRMISDTVGCHNKFSINKNSAGVFFADDFGKSFNQFTINGGIQDIGTKAEFSRWFKKNLNGHLWSATTRDNFRVSYDEVTHDLYIIKDKATNSGICLVYNTLLGKFTSFMDYLDTPMITRLISNRGASDTFAIRNAINTNKSVVEIWKMFAGVQQTITVGSNTYNYSYYGYIYGKFCPYSMEYRLTPDPMHDSIFTNYCYSADWIDPTKEVDEDNQFDTSARRYTTFDTVEAKNEYQQGKMNIPTSRMGRWPIKAKFRIWRGDIPRDGYTTSGLVLKGDRMRNPWIHLKFEKSTTDNSKMIFHNLTVTYYNQYGRY